MTSLVGNYAAVLHPSAAPIILIVIGLISAPSDAHRSKNELPKTACIKSLLGLYNWYIESILLYHE